MKLLLVLLPTLHLACLPADTEYQTTPDQTTSSTTPTTPVSPFPVPGQDPTTPAVSDDPSLVDPVQTVVKVIRYADLDGNDVIDAADSALFEGVLRGEVAAPTPEEMTEILKRMDLNADGAVNNLDYMMLQEYLLGNITGFPVKELVYGDVNMDGVIGQQDVEILTELTKNTSRYNAGNRVASDLNEDGRFTPHDVQILRNYIAKTFDGFPQKVVLGDLDFDQVIDADDLALATEILKKGLVYRFSDAKIPGTANEVRQVMALDLNDNGLVGRELDPFDEYIFSDFLRKNVQAIPYPIYYGDLDANGTIDQLDVNLGRQLYDKELEPTSNSQLLALDVNRDFDDKAQVKSGMTIDRLDMELLLLAVTEKPELFAEGPLECRYGDYNHDHLVDTKDLALLQSYLGGRALPEHSCSQFIVDLNLDGSLGPEDEALLQQRIDGTLEGNLFPGEKEYLDR